MIIIYHYQLGDHILLLLTMVCYQDPVVKIQFQRMVNSFIIADTTGNYVTKAQHTIQIFHHSLQMGIFFMKEDPPQ